MSKQMLPWNSVQMNARKALNGKCQVCPVCNGSPCTGRTPGPGGKGSGKTFMRMVGSRASHRLFLVRPASARSMESTSESSLRGALLFLLLLNIGFSPSLDFLLFLIYNLSSFTEGGKLAL